jgi:hypothetical protein
MSVGQITTKEAGKLYNNEFSSMTEWDTSPLTDCPHYYHLS